MAMLKLPFPEGNGHLMFDVSQIANVEVSGGRLALRLQGEDPRYIYEADLANVVEAAILRSRTDEDKMPVIEVVQSHHTNRWEVFAHRHSHFVGRGEHEQPGEGCQEG